MSECCIRGFRWGETPTGKEGVLANNKAYIAGSNSNAAVLMIHDVYGWTFSNLRLLADHFAKEADATVYLPDFFGGEVIPPDTMDDPEKWKNFNLGAFMGKNSRAIRWPEISACARALKEEHKFKRVVAVGYCYGGFGCLLLGDRNNPLVDAISMAHPSHIEKSEIDNVGVPVQIIAPEHDHVFSPEQKEYCNKVIPTLGVEYDYQHFPGLMHGFAVKGDPNNKAQKEGLERAKNAAVYWLRQYLHV